jgi:hypothetical protein
VVLEQRFKQGKFQDTGPKELVVVRDNGDLRIAREEMLSSTVVGKQRAAAAGVAETYLMLDGEVLLEEDTSLDIRGKPALDPADGSASFRARVAVDRAGVPLAGKTFTVYGADGASCQSRLDRVSLVSGITPHFGTVAEWHGQGDTPALSEAEIADIVAFLKTLTDADQRGDQRTGPPP